MKLIDRLKLAGRLITNQFSDEPPPALVAETAEYLSGHGYDVANNFYGVVSRLDLLRFATLRRCVEIIATQVASVPLCVFDARTGKKVQPGVRTRGALVARLIAEGLDERYSNSELVEMIAADLAFDGNFYFRVEGSEVMPTALEYCQSQGTDVYLPSPRGGRVYYLRSVYGDFPWGRLPEQMVVHGALTRLLIGQQGRIKGVGPATSVRSAVSTGIAGDAYVGRELAGEALHNKLLLRTVKELSPEQLRSYRDNFRAAARARSQSPLILQNMGDPQIGNQLVPLNQNVVGGQKALSDLRAYQVEDVARVFGVPPSLLGVKGTDLGKGIMEKNRAFIKFGLRPYFAAVERAFTYRLLRGTQFEVRFDLPASMLVDLPSMAQVVSRLGGGTQGPGFITRNEGREWLGLPPMQGEEYDELPEMTGGAAQGLAGEGGEGRPPDTPDPDGDEEEGGDSDE